MPNWCNNTLYVSGPDDELRRFYRLNAGLDFAGDFTELSLNALVPAPENTKNWNNWCNSNWGTKWDIEPSLNFDPNEEPWPDQLIYNFQSAWSPPVEWLKTIRPFFPELEFQLEYFEGGMGFTGQAFSDGPEDVIEDTRNVTSEDSHGQGFHDGDPQIDCDECDIEDFVLFHDDHSEMAEADITQIEDRIMQQCVICRHMAGLPHPADACERCPLEIGGVTPQKNPEPDKKRQAFRWMQYTWSIDKAEELIAKRQKKISPEMIDVDKLYTAIKSHGISIDEDYALAKADLSKPLILGLVKSQGQWFHILIDGYHRLYRAKHEGIKRLPAHLLTKIENHQASMGAIRPPIRKN